MAGAPTTPYNSIYSYIKPGSGQTPPPPKKGPCCLHGKECLKEDDEESSPYVNLLVPKISQQTGKEMEPVASEEMSEERRNKNLRILAREMKTLQLGVESERHRKSHEKKKKKKSEDSSRKRSKSTKTDSEDSPNPLRSGGEDEERKEPSKPRKKKKKRERSPDNRKTFGTDSSTERKKSRKKEEKKSRVEDSEKKESKKMRESRKSQEKKKHNRTLDFFPTREKTLQTSYLGVKTWKEAEAVVSEPSDFRLYHRMGEALLNELEPSLPLFLVYKAASGKYKHYRVRQVTVGETTTYMVEHGQMNAEVHASLEHLVRFYHTQFYRHEKNGEQQVDAFPCWSDSS